MKEYPKRIVTENKYVALLIDSICLILVKLEFEILCNY